MSTQPWSQANVQSKHGLTWFANIAARVIAVAIGYSIIPALLLGGKPSLSAAYLQTVLIYLISGAVYALVLLPLARRLPYRMLTRTLALFIPLYWTAILANIVEAYFFTTYSPFTLTVGAILLAVPAIIACLLIAWLFPAYEQEQPVLSIWQSLSQRPLLSWIWRIVIVGLLYPIFLEYVFGNLAAPFIGKYYHDPAYMVQSHTISQPIYIVWLDETLRGMLFAVSLLPVLAVMRGRSWPKILYTVLYLSLIGAAFEAWLGTLAQTSWPLLLRIGEGLNLTGDALSRGVFIALFLALPALTDTRQSREEERAGATDSSG